MLVRGKYIITDAETKEAGILTNGAVYVTKGIITEVNDYQSLREKYPEAAVKGDGRSRQNPQDRLGKLQFKINALDLVLALGFDGNDDEFGCG